MRVGATWACWARAYHPPIPQTSNFPTPAPLGLARVYFWDWNELPAPVKHRPRSPPRSIALGLV